MASRDNSGMMKGGGGLGFRCGDPTVVDDLRESQTLKDEKTKYYRKINKKFT